MHRIIILFLLFFPLLLNAGRQEADTLLTHRLEEILITGSRLGTNPLLIPASITSITLREAALGRASGLNDIASGIPGVLVQSRSGSQDVRLTIRGFGSRGNGDRSNAGTIRGVKVLIDGFPETEPDGRTSLDLFEPSITRKMEVVRSNVSTLFGNASGGLINLETGSLSDERTIRFSSLAGSHGLFRTGMTIFSPLEAGSVFFSYTRGTFKGWRENSASSSSHAYALVRTTLGSGRLKAVASSVDSRFEIPGALTTAQFDQNPAAANATYRARKERRMNNVGRVGLSFTQALSDEFSVEALGYVTPKILQRSERNTFRDFNRIHLGGGVVARYVTADRDAFFTLRPLLSAGVDYALQDGSQLFYSQVNGERGDSLRTNKQERALSYGFFLHSEFNLSQDLGLHAGLRFDGAQYVSYIHPTAVNRFTRKDDLSFTHATPRVALLYRLSQNHSIYIGMSGGLELPAFNEVDPPPSLSSKDLNPLLKPMTSLTYEAGMKGAELMKGFLRELSYDAAVYTIRSRNEIIPFDGGAYFESSGITKRTGIEAAFTLRSRADVGLRGSVTYLSAVYDEYSPGGAVPDYKGNAVPGIVPLTLHGVFFATVWGIEMECAYLWRDEYYADDANMLMVPSAGIVRVGLSTVLELEPFRLILGAGVENLFNVRYASSAFVNPVVPSPLSSSFFLPAYLEPGLPRNYYATMALSAEL